MHTVASFYVYSARPLPRVFARRNIFPEHYFYFYRDHVENPLSPHRDYVHHLSVIIILPLAYIPVLYFSTPLTLSYVYF